MVKLMNRSTGDLLVLMIAGTICFGVFGLAIAAIVYVFVHPGADVSDVGRLVTGTLNSLIGLLAGFMVGRTTELRLPKTPAATPPVPPSVDLDEPGAPKDERGQLSILRAMLAESEPPSQQESTDGHRRDPSP